mgnify:CR=1 FL=1
MDEFLNELTLQSEQDQVEGESIYIMSIHASKGLEFKHVFIIGLEEGFLPLIGDGSDTEEERRLGYVAITRAESELTMSHVASRFYKGRRTELTKSRFFKETGLCEGSFILEKNTTYYWQVMFFDGNEWSLPSEMFSFVTESTGPDFIDGVDSEDMIVKKLKLGDDFVDQNKNPVNTDTIKSFASRTDPDFQIGMIAHDCKIIKCAARDSQTFAGDGISEEDVSLMPFGLITFELSVPNKGDSATVTFHFSKQLPHNTSWWQFDPNVGFYDYEESTPSRVVSFSQDLRSVTIKFKDGGYGDLLSEPDCKIIDPSGAVSSSEDDSSGGGGGGGGCFLGGILF